MDKNNGDLVSDQFDRELYKKALNEITDHNPELAVQLIPILALRAAARALPLLVINDHLNFWIEKNKDNRVQHLAGVMNATGIFRHLSPDLAAESAHTTYGSARTADFLSKQNGLAASLPIYATAYAAAAAAYAEDTTVAAAYALAAASAGTRLRSDLLGALKADLSNALSILPEHFSDFKQSSLWLWHSVPDWYVESVHQLIRLIDELPYHQNQEAEWAQIVDGLTYLKNQGGILDDAGASISTLEAEKLHRRIIYEATHISYAESPALEDKLNRKQLVNALAINLIGSANSHHRAIGLLGEWGSGKSTVLDLLKKLLKELNNEQPYIFGEFNAWAYEHTDNIQAGVAQEMINALTGSPDILQPLYTPTATFFEKLKTVLFSDVRRVIAIILNKIPVTSNMSLRWFGERCSLTIRFASKAHPIELLKILLLLLVAAMPWFSEWFQGLIEISESSNNRNSWIWTGGVFLYTLREFGKLIISPQAKELLTYLRLPSYAEHLGTIPVMRKHICTLCNLRLKQKNGKTPRLLFVVDDLDRCSPSAIVKVLEAVRLVLDLDNVIVIIAIDQHIALAALSEHFKDFSPHHKLKNSHAIAREYLSKVINLPIVLTKPSSDDVRVFMGSFWEEMNITVEKEINESKSKLETADMTNVSESSGVRRVGDSRTDGGNITQDTSAAGNKIPDALATGTVDLDGSVPSNVEVEPAPTIKPVKALSKDHQECFINWVNYFELSNSRQLKRLNNSYDLMRSYLPLMDREVSEFEFAEYSVSKVYPMLLTLILMEYLNSLHDLEERNQLWGRLFGESAASLGESVGNKLVSTAFIKAYRSLLAAEGNQSLVANVEAFVLPAMT